jgi:CRP-like cAMP-binding protein
VTTHTQPTPAQCREIIAAASDPMRVFGSVRSLDARSLAGPALEVQVPAGEQLVHAGDLIGTFFVIRSGSAELLGGSLGPMTLAAGDCFGEIDAIAPHPQPFNVVARSPMRLLTFSALGIDRLCATIPGVRQRLLDSLPPS